MTRRGVLVLAAILAVIVGTSVVLAVVRRNEPVVPFADNPVPAPARGGGAKPFVSLQLKAVTWEQTVPAVGSDDTFDFVVRFTNVGNETFNWPASCPVYSWDYSESATIYAQGYGVLNCADAAPIGRGDSEDFAMEIPSSDQKGGLRLGWGIVDPRVCNSIGWPFGSRGVGTPWPEPGVDPGCTR